MLTPSILIKLINMKPPEPLWLTATQALMRLGVARQTLYAYVSRGLVAAAPAPGDPRRSLYSAADIAALLARKRRGRTRRAVASSTISWGEPILASGITRIAGGRIAYRDEDALALSERWTLEQVAALLWQSPLPSPEPTTWPSAEAPVGIPALCIAAAAGIADWGRWTAAPEPAAAEAMRIITRLAWAASGQPGPPPTGIAGPLHRRLAEAWGVDARAAGLIRQALVLVADHELNASTYAARVVASTRAPLGACVLAGLAALSGPLHGGMTASVRTLLADPALAAEPEATLAARLAQGEQLPGFGHTLYPEGDPRGAALLAALGGPLPPLVAAMRAATGLAPNIDFALVLLESRLRLPPGAAFALFATGRCVGWIAHALEQWREGSLIRPRAVFREGA